MSKIDELKQLEEEEKLLNEEAKKLEEEELRILEEERLLVIEEKEYRRTVKMQRQNGVKPSTTHEKTSNRRQSKDDLDIVKTEDKKKRSLRRLSSERKDGDSRRSSIDNKAVRGHIKESKESPDKESSTKEKKTSTLRKLLTRSNVEKPTRNKSSPEPHTLSPNDKEGLLRRRSAEPPEVSPLSAQNKKLSRRSLDIATEGTKRSVETEREVENTKRKFSARVIANQYVCTLQTHQLID